MSDSEYEQQQYIWKQRPVDPYLLQSVIDGKNDDLDDNDDEDAKQIKQDLRERLWVIVLQKIEKTLTPRQQDAIKLFLMGKKQEHMGSVLGVTQEAANVRIRLGLERLKKTCDKDKEIQEILAQLK